MWRNRKAFAPSVVEALDAWFATERRRRRSSSSWTRGPASAAASSSTRPATGRYHTYLCDEVVPVRRRALPDAGRAGAPRHRRQVSGGYGAMVTPMLRPDLFGGLATHAGDALFEACYQPDFRQAARALRDTTPARSKRSGPTSGPARRARRGDGVLVNVWCMAACYSADPDGTVRLPFEPLTGRLIPEVWERWLAWDPVRMVAAHADALRGLRAIWIDAGTQRRVLPRPWRRGVPVGARRIGVGDARRPLRAVRRRLTAGSSGATRRRSAGWRSSSRPRAELARWTLCSGRGRPSAERAFAWRANDMTFRPDVELDPGQVQDGAAAAFAEAASRSAAASAAS